MPLILTTDLHLTGQDRDTYRWLLFDKLRNLVAGKSLRRDNTLVILGDLTDSKDGHRSHLVNTICDNLKDLSSIYGEIHILKGNHDYIDANRAFFNFLNCIPDIRFYTRNTTSRIHNDAMLCMFLPHTRVSGHLADVIKSISKRGDKIGGKLDYVFMHQTVEGAVAENGQKLEGLSMRAVRALPCPVYSGDVHVPQTIRNLTYVGSPYHVRFGDSFEPRVIHIENGVVTSIPTGLGKKEVVTVRTSKDLDSLRELDSKSMVKVLLEIDMNNISTWRKARSQIQQICDEKDFRYSEIEMKNLNKNILLSENKFKNAVTLTPEKMIEQVGVSNKLPQEAIEIGRNLFNGTDRT